MRISSATALLPLCATLAQAATPAEWRSRSIYQLLTDRFAREDNSTTAACDTEDREYCGGTWRGIINRLDYIQGMGFDAIWISPVTLNLMQDTSDGTSYHGYWQQNLYALNTPFGDADDLNALSTALHDRDMYLMVDVVVNHNGWAGNEDTVDYSDFYPFNSESYYHPYCAITNYDNQTNVEDCWLGDSAVELVDLKTESDVVANMYYTWITSLVANYSIDGLRIDTVKHVDSAFWPGFNAAAGVFCTGEVYDGDPAYTCPYQEVLDSVLNYMTYYPLIRAFQSTTGSIPDLVNEINTVKSSCKDSTLLASFSENQDLPRFASLTPDLAQAQNVLAFTLLADGIPVLYAGQEQHYAGAADPSNREATWLSAYDTSAPLYGLAASLNQLRRRAIAVDAAYLTYMNYPIYSDTTTIAMRKGFDGNQIIAVLSNKGESGASYSQPISGTGWASGTEVVEVLTCVSQTIDGSDELVVPMASGLPRIYFPAAQLTGSGICDM